MGETENGLSWDDWNKVVEDCDRQFAQIEATRKNMNLAEKIQKQIKGYAKRERSKYQQPKPEIMEDTETQTPEETPETSEESTE